jgi:hypothetical protein
MTGLREAARMALHALQESKPIDIDDPTAFYRSAHAIEALRAALANEFNPDWDAMAVMVEEQQRMAKRIEELESAAQPKQEPVAWRYTIGEGDDYLVSTKKPNLFYGDGKGGFRVDNGEPLYTAPPQRKFIGLTDEEIEDACWTEVDQRLRSFTRAIEAKLKEKNA